MGIVILIVVCIFLYLILKRRLNKSIEKPRQQKMDRTDIKSVYSEITLSKNPENTFDHDNPEKVRKKREPIDYTQATPRQIENENIKKGILNNMEWGEEYTLADMLCTFDCFPADMTPHRLAALLSQLGPKGSEEITRSERDGKAYFSLIIYKGQDELTPREIENNSIIEGILKKMKPGEMYSLADMLCTFDCFPADMTPHRLAALLSQLGSHGTGEIDRSEEKGKAFFYLAGSDISRQRTANNIENNEIKHNANQTSPRQLENELIKKGILINMEPGIEYSLPDILCAFDCFPADMTPHRLAALLSQLGEKGAGDVSRYERDNKAYFKLTETGKQRRIKYREEGALDELKKMIFNVPVKNTFTGPNNVTSFQSKNQFSYSNTKSQSQRRQYYTDLDGRKYYYDKNGIKKYKQERVYLTDWDGREYYINKNGERKYKQERKSTLDEDPFEDAAHYNYYRNGITDHGTFVGTCKMCGIVWEFRSVEVIPAPYPHGTCPRCHQWVAVF